MTMAGFASTANRSLLPLPGPRSTNSTSSDLPFRGHRQDLRRIYRKMAAPIPLLDSGLVAVCLIIRSREGPRFVFHHPPRPSLQTSQRENLYGTDLIEEPEENPENHEESDESDLEDGNYALPQAFGKLGFNQTANSLKSSHVHQPMEGDEHYDNKKGEHIVPWEHIFEWNTTDLESILTPSRAFHKKKFELCLDPLLFVTYPMHIREGGGWKKKKAKKTKKVKKSLEDGEGGASAAGGADDEKPADNGSEDGEDHGGMTMFNVVFILNISKQQVDAKILEIYEHVVKKFNKALNHAQAQGNYVWKESEMILGMKEKAREERRPMSWLWQEILLRSNLAASIRDIYIAIANNKIATVQLATTPPLNLSLQIPVPSFLTSLPAPNERAMPGLLLTSANPLVSEAEDDDSTNLNKHFALLLLDDEDKIVAEIQTDNTELTAPLLECIRLCKPTQSFLQVAQANSISLDSLLTLSQHLIYWRKAIAIPPLHARETYIVSPNCDSRKLWEASVAWKKAFPLSPSLSSFLATLSSAPRQYKTFAPSRNHRPIYLDMLAWLIRGGWVTQLRTFAWILVWPEIIYEVDYQLKSDALDKANKKATSSQPTSSGESAGSTDESGPDKVALDPSAPMTTEQAAENARLQRLAEKTVQDAADSAASFSELPVPVATEHPSANNAGHLKRYAPYIIKDPHKVSHEESLYIAAIGKRFNDDAKPKQLWGKWAKYFNGDDALEMIPLREGLKRKETWGVLAAYQEHLLFCKHW